MGLGSNEGKIEYTPEHKEVKQSDSSKQSSNYEKTVEKTKEELAKVLSK